MALGPGTICLIEFPFTEQAATGKVRPALVIEPLSGIYLAVSEGDRSTQQHAIFLPITSKISPGQYNIVVDPTSPGFGSTGLLVPSTILCWKIYTIPKLLMSRTLGIAPEALLADVRNRLRVLLSL